jgi:hypothetical protein
MMKLITMFEGRHPAPRRDRESGQQNATTPARFAVLLCLFFLVAPLQAKATQLYESAYMLIDGPLTQLATPLTVIEGDALYLNFGVTEETYGPMDIGAVVSFAPKNVAGDPDDDITKYSFDSPYHLINPPTNKETTFTLYLSTADAAGEAEDFDSGEWSIGVEFKAWFNPSYDLSGNPQGVPSDDSLPSGITEYVTVQDTPEPGSLGLLSAGVVGVLACANRRRRPTEFTR